MRPWMLRALLVAALLPLPAADRKVPRTERAPLLADLKALADPALEGRGMGTKGLAKARDFVLDRFKALGLEPVGGRFEHPFEARNRHGVNLAAFIPGRIHKDEAIVLSAHLDHLGIRQGAIHPGADDDASGVSAVLAMAAWLKAHPPAHSVILALFDGEEVGLLGSRAFLEKSPWPKDRIRMNLNLDMVGRSDTGELWICGAGRWPKLRPAAEAAAGASALKVRLGHDGKDGLQDWTQSSDHGSFHKAGIPFLYLGEDDHADYHRPTDTFERIQPDFLHGAVETALDLLVELDAHPQMMDRP